MNNAIFRKTMENVRNRRDIMLRRNYLVSEPKYYTAKCFLKNLLVTETKKTQILMNKPVYLGLSILE